MCGNQDCLNKYFKAILHHTITREKGLKKTEINVYQLEHCCDCKEKRITVQCPECRSTKRYYDESRGESYCGACGLVF